MEVNALVAVDTGRRGCATREKVEGRRARGGLKRTGTVQVAAGRGVGVKVPRQRVESTCRVSRKQQVS